MYLPDILKFVGLMNEFRQVKRVLWVNNEDRMENDVEHSYRLAMLAWYVINSHKLDLDINLALKYSLVHDLVEVYAGDTYIYTTDQNHKNSKFAREKESATRLKKEFEEFGDIHELIEKYENRSDKESKFIYALDKIEPVLSIYTDGGRTWKKENITIQMLVDHKKDKVALSPEVEIYFTELVELLKKEECRLFSAE